MELITDAMNEDLGFHSGNGQTGQALWSPAMHKFHINRKEFATVSIAIHRGRFARESCLMHHLDNLAVVKCLSGGGLTKSVSLLSWPLLIPCSLASRNLNISAVHIKK